jgi:hypothetical protein
MTCFHKPARPLRHANQGSPNEETFDYDIIEMALAHIDPNETRRSHNHAKYLPRRRIMMDGGSNRIDKTATGNMSMTTNTKGLRAIN